MVDSSIHFRISFIEPQAHYVEVEVIINNFTQEFVNLKMPVWTPGSYLIREYARHVESLTASVDSELVRSEKINKNTWRIKNKKGTLRVRYRVYGFEVSVRTNFIDIDHAYLNPAATFMYIEGAINHASTVEIILPEYWKKISTGLPQQNSKPNTFLAENFDILFDTPIEIGNQDTWTFDAAGVQHEFAMVGGGDYNKNKLTQDVTRIVEVETELWGENPNDRYVFITHNRHHGSGGLEHLNSTVLGATRFAYNIESSYKSYLSLIAHEYFQ